MLERNLVIVIDSDSRRRAMFAAMLTDPERRAAPCETPEELSLLRSSPFALIVHDEGEFLKRSTTCMNDLGFHAPVLLYGDVPDPARVVDAIFAGAADYLPFPMIKEDMLARLDIALARYAPIATRRETALRAKAILMRLSAREREVVSGMAEGLTNKMIGQQLGISPRTVEIHRNNALNKLGANHSADAIRIAIEAEDFTAS